MLFGGWRNPVHTYADQLSIRTTSAADAGGQRRQQVNKTKFAGEKEPTEFAGGRGCGSRTIDCSSILIFYGI